MNAVKKAARELTKLQSYLKPTKAAERQYMATYSALADIDNDVNPTRDSGDLYIDDAQPATTLGDFPVAVEPESLPQEALDSAYEWSEIAKWSCEARRMLFLAYVTHYYGDYVASTAYVNSLPRMPLWLWSRSLGGRRGSTITFPDGTTLSYGDLKLWTVNKTKLFLQRTTKQWLTWAKEQKQRESLQQ